MDYQITVGQNNKFLFRTDAKSLHSSDALVGVFSIFLQKFPASEGFYITITVSWPDSVSVDIADFTEAIKRGKGKGYLISLKDKRRRARIMTILLYNNIKQGLI